MKRPRLGRLKWPLLGLVLGPPILWGLLLILAPTDWARLRLETALKQATGHEVRLQRVALGLLGELRLRGLEFRDPDRSDPPWLEADEIALGLNPLQLLVGRYEPSRVVARGISARLRREPGGSFEFAHLLRTTRRGGSMTLRPGSEDPEVAFQLVDGRVTLIDEPNSARLELTDLKGHGTWRRHHARIEQLIGRLDDGAFVFEAEMERGVAGPMFESDFKARGVRVGSDGKLLTYLLPMLAGPNRSLGLSGRLDLNLYLRCQGDSCADLANSIEGQGALRLDSITPAGTGLLGELSRALSLPAGARLADVHGPFSIAKGRIMTQQMALDIGSLPVVLDGWTDFEGRYDYRVRSESLAEAIAPELRSLVPDLPMSVDEALDLRLQGGEGPARILVGGLPLGVDASGRPLSNRDRAKEVARRLRDRFLR